MQKFTRKICNKGYHHNCQLKKHMESETHQMLAKDAEKADDDTSPCSHISLSDAMGGIFVDRRVPKAYVIYLRIRRASLKCSCDGLGLYVPSMLVVKTRSDLVPTKYGQDNRKAVDTVVLELFSRLSKPLL
jgi:hypothetical protein